MPRARCPYDPKGSELLLGTDAVDVVVKATAARAGQIAAATENASQSPRRHGRDERGLVFSILGRYAAKQRRRIAGLIDLS
jgi:hypothetical protein